MTGLGLRTQDRKDFFESVSLSVFESLLNLAIGSCSAL